MVVYIVHGITGEYEDRREWIAGIFETEEWAEQFKWMCQNDAHYMLDEVEDEDGAVYPRYYGEEYTGHDPEFQIDYTGTWYQISRHITREGV